LVSSELRKQLNHCEDEIAEFTIKLNKLDPLNYSFVLKKMERENHTVAS